MSSTQEHEQEQALRDAAERIYAREYTRYANMSDGGLQDAHQEMFACPPPIEYGREQIIQALIGG